jgi:hypothetical protein
MLLIETHEVIILHFIIRIVNSWLFTKQTKAQALV